MTKKFSKDKISHCRPEVCKHKGFSIVSGTLKVKWVVSVHGRAGPDWHRKV